MKEALRQIIETFDRIPGGISMNNYSPRNIENWVKTQMRPLIEDARARLAAEDERIASAPPPVKQPEPSSDKSRTEAAAREATAPTTVIDPSINQAATDGKGRPIATGEKAIPVENYRKR